MRLHKPVKLSLSGMRCVMDSGMPHVQTMEATQKRQVSDRLAAMLPGDIIKSSGYVEAKCRFADTTPFRMSYIIENEGGFVESRIGIASLDINIDNIELMQPLDSPAGVPVGWRHDLDYHNPIGRVKSMYIEGNELVGTIMLSEAEVSAAMPGGMEDLRQGLNTGLSIGFLGDNLLQIEKKDGTQVNPDEVSYEGIRIYEVSLTPLPRLPMAGILGITAKGESGESVAEPDGATSEG